MIKRHIHIDSTSFMYRGTLVSIQQNVCKRELMISSRQSKNISCGLSALNPIFKSILMVIKNLICRFFMTKKTLKLVLLIDELCAIIPSPSLGSFNISLLMIAEMCMTSIISFSKCSTSTCIFVIFQEIRPCKSARYSKCNISMVRIMIAISVHKCTKRNIVDFHFAAYLCLRVGGVLICSSICIRIFVSNLLSLLTMSCVFHIFVFVAHFQLSRFAESC